MFEKASRLKLRFETEAGLLNVEDLWDLHLKHPHNVDLDDIAKTLSQATKESSEESFVEEKSGADDRLQLAFDLVKHVISVRLKERKEKENAAAAKAKKNKILEILEDKEHEELKGKSSDELKEMIADL